MQNLFSPIKSEVTRIEKNGEEITKTGYNSLTAQDLWQTVKLSIKSEVTRIEKNGEEITKTGYNSLTAQDLWQTDYQILLIILLRKFTKSNLQTLIHVFLNT